MSYEQKQDLMFKVSGLLTVSNPKRDKFFTEMQKLVAKYDTSDNVVGKRLAVC